MKTGSIVVISREFKKFCQKSNGPISAIETTFATLQGRRMVNLVSAQEEYRINDLQTFEN